MSVVAFDRRRFLAGSATLLAAGSLASAQSAPAGIVNPLVRQRADAQIFRDADGTYYLTGSVPEYDRLVLRRARTLAGLSQAAEVVLWRRPAAGKLGGYIWAPELHRIDGRWYLYFGAGDADSLFRVRLYVLQCAGTDPMAGPWSVLGRMETPWDTFTLDPTCFLHRGIRYFCWAQHEPGIVSNSNIYLAPMAGPAKLARPPVRLTTPTLDWEMAGEKVNEAPAFLAHGDKVFLTYSAAATDARYCLGMLTAAADADLMDPAAWTKSPTPVFVTSPTTGVYGPGHNAFTVDEEGRDILVYHGRDYEKVASPLQDPNRHTRLQRLYFKPDGTPDFGLPVGNGSLPIRLATDRQASVFLCHDGRRLLAGAGSLPASQFREANGPARDCPVALQPIDAPDLRLCVQQSGTVVLTPVASDPAFPLAARFIRRAGLADPAAVSYESVFLPGAYLQCDGPHVSVHPAPDAACRRRATFYVR